MAPRPSGSSPASKAPALRLDVRDPTAVGAAVAGVVRRHGGLDVAVAYAGIEKGGPAHELDPATFARVVEVNLLSFLTAQAAARAMIERGRGGSAGGCRDRRAAGAWGGSQPVGCAGGAGEGAARGVLRTVGVHAWR
jgi:NAD(P)-dependent dehydrogenase (short-subunit alcohol dehydrogenase family)